MVDKSASHPNPPIAIDTSIVNLAAKPKCLILCTGHVSTVRMPELVADLSETMEVAVLCTEKAKFMLEKARFHQKRAWIRFQASGGWSLVLSEKNLRESTDILGRSALQALLYSWADVLIVAPASSNVIAKSSCGIADNFVLSIMRAWDFRKPCILCPAMDTVMWTHPSTQESLSRLQAWGWEVLGPQRSGAVPIQDIKSSLLKVIGSRVQSVGNISRENGLAVPVIREIKKLLAGKKTQRALGKRAAKHFLLDIMTMRKEEQKEGTELNWEEINMKARRAACMTMSF